MTALKLCFCLSRAAIILACFGVSRAQDIPPELAQLKTPYVQAVTTIRANAEARAKPIVTSYLAALSRMEKQFASDPVLSAMVVQEIQGV